MTETIDEKPPAADSNIGGPLYAKPRLADWDDDEEFVIETDLTEEEHAIIEEGMKRYREHPETFTLLEDIK
jgi:hypothetical protein